MLYGSVIHFLLLESHFIAWIDHSLFIHFPIDRRINCLQFGAIVNSAAINSHIQVLMWAYAVISLAHKYTQEWDGGFVW